MKTKISALLLILAIILSSISMSITAYAEIEEDPKFPCGGVIEEIKVRILYTPLSNLISISETEPTLTGTVLKITYPDGTSEIYTVEENEGCYSAGKFSVSVYRFNGVNMGEVINYGLVSQTLSVYFDDEFPGGYDGDTEFVFLHLPSFEDIYQMISVYFK
ncbi:MAG: hypothetical protein IJE74_03190 [Clostridia bacterium]|nr:hypothetical protein [Clostridia bacterium]